MRAMLAFSIINTVVQCAASTTQFAFLGPGMFIAANANQLVRISTFVGNGDLWNNYTTEFLRSST